MRANLVEVTDACIYDAFDVEQRTYPKLTRASIFLIAASALTP